jgi:hypothetical protein
MESKNNIKQFIVSSIRDLDRGDLIDICRTIKMHGNDSAVSVNTKGSYIDLDKLDDALLLDLNNIIKTKLKRITSNN